MAAFEQRLRVARLRGKDGKRRQIRIPFDERWSRTETLDRVRKKRPHFGAYRTAMRIDKDVPVTREAGEVNLGDMARRHCVDVAVRIPAMVACTHVDVVDVEQDAAAGA